MSYEAWSITLRSVTGELDDEVREQAEKLRSTIEEACPGAAVNLVLEQGDGEKLVVVVPQETYRNIKRAASAPGVRQSLNDWIVSACKLRLIRDKHVMPRAGESEDWDEWDEFDDRRRNRGDRGDKDDR